MVKMVSLSEDAYRILKGLKKKDESFSKTVIRLTEKPKKRDIMELAGAWKDMPEMDGIFKGIIEGRHTYKGRQRVEL